MKKILVAASFAVASLLAACTSTPNQTKVPLAAKAAPVPSGVNISGTWAFSIDTPTGKGNTKLIANQTGEAFTGSIDAPQGALPIAGTVKGNAIAFTMKMTTQGMNMTIDYRGTVEGNAMQGMATFGNFGEGKFTATKE